MSDPSSALKESSPEVSARSWRSLGALLFVQAQNAFNDNFVKLTLITLTVAVAAGSTMGKYIENILAAMIPLPFILFAPLAGWLSDRYPKSRVIYLMLILKVLIFGLFLAALALRSLPLALAADFLFVLQSTLFSPAKFGILKELVGSKKLGVANGLVQMLTMIGILGGMAVAGWWFDHELVQRNSATVVSADNAWQAGIHLFVWGGALALVPLVIGLMIQRTPEHPEQKFRPAILFSHFSDLRYAFGHVVLKRTILFIAGYWFVANFIGLLFFGFAKDLHPNAAEGGVGESSSQMFIVTGLGLTLGSLLVSFFSRKGNRLILTIYGGLGVAVGLFAMGTLASGIGPWLGAVALTGFASGFFLVPLSTHLQDQIEESARGRVLSAQNLIISFSGIVAILMNVGLKMINVSTSKQALILGALTMIMTGFLIRLLKTSALYPRSASSE